MSSSAAMRFVTAAVLALAVVGCRSGTSPFTGLGREIEGAQLTDRQLRLQLYEFVRRFAAYVEAAADEVEEGARGKEPATVSWAREWKIQTIAGCQSAAMDADPYLGFVDVFVLTVQMRGHLESAQVAERIGEDNQTILLGAMDAIDAERAALGERALPEEARFERRGELEDWAEENPIRADFTRPSISAEIASGFTGKRPGTLAVAGNLDARMEDLVDRVTVYAEILPKQARWQAEVLASKVMVAVLDEVLLIIEELQATIVNERIAVLEAMQRERELVLAEVDRQRQETLAFVRAEREVLIMDTIAVLTEQMEATREWGELQRIAAGEQVEALLSSGIRESTDEVSGMIDRALLWIGLGALALSFLGFLAALVLLGRLVPVLRAAQRG